MYFPEAGLDHTNRNRETILLIHYEGSFNQNPNLNAIILRLCEEGYYVDILTPRRKFLQRPVHANCRIVFRNLFVEQIKNKVLGFHLPYGIYSLACRFAKNASLGRGYDFVVGVDRYGIIEASIIAEMIKVPYALLSYEIIFAAETNKKCKKIEIAACKNIAFAVCQDAQRTQLLCQENDIDPSQVVTLPVSDTAIQRMPKSNYLHDTLDIPRSKKIALFVGDIASRTMLSDLILTIHDWPDDFVFVIHGLNMTSDNLAKAGISRITNTDRIFLSRKAFLIGEEFSSMVSDADVGLAFWKKTIKEGKMALSGGLNTEVMGMASGKIATYLRHGVPVITNISGEMRQHIDTYRLGVAVDGISQLPDALRTISKSSSWQSACTSFYSSHLDLSKNIIPLLRAIDNAISQCTSPV